MLQWRVVECIDTRQGNIQDSIKERQIYRAGFKRAIEYAVRYAAANELYLHKDTTLTGGYWRSKEGDIILEVLPLGIKSCAEEWNK